MKHVDSKTDAWLREMSEQAWRNKTRWGRFVIRLRKTLLMPFSCRWNGWVRDSTARMELWRPSIKSDV